MHILKFPSLFITKMTKEPHGQPPHPMTPFSKNSYNCFFNSSNANMNYLHNNIFGKVEFDKKCVSSSTSLLGGIPFEIWITYLYVYKLTPNLELLFFLILHLI